MLQIIMPNISRHWKGKQWLIIDGGWIALVPEVRVEQDAIGAYAAYLLQEGVPFAEARQRANDMMQERFNYGFLAGLKSSIMGYAVKYAVMWPEHRLIEPVWITGTERIRLRGFKPEVMQTCYVPEQKPGQFGLAYAKDMLRKMGKEAKTP